MSIIEHYYAWGPSLSTVRLITAALGFLSVAEVLLVLFLMVGLKGRWASSQRATLIQHGCVTFCVAAACWYAYNNQFEVVLNWLYGLMFTIIVGFFVFYHLLSTVVLIRRGGLASDESDHA